MKRADAFELLGRARAPAALDRAHRVKLLGEAGTALLDGKLPRVEAAAFLGGAIVGWLENGGDLARDYLRIIKPKSHQTPARLWAQVRDAAPHQDERQGGEAVATIPPTSNRGNET